MKEKCYQNHTEIFRNIPGDKQIKSALAITFASLGFIGYGMPLLAQPNQPASNNSISLKIQFNAQEADGASRGRPSGRGGTGSRGDCPSVNVPLTALVPANNPGLAVEAHPTLWFYIPYKSDKLARSEFSLQDEQNNDVYRTALTLPQTPGIVSLSLAQAPPLEVNQKYKWHFKLYCSKNKSSVPVFVSGKVQRTNLKPELEKQLKAATTPRERIALYAQNGIWYSAINELAKLRLAEPQNKTLNSDWANLLSDVGLRNLVKEPIINEQLSMNNYQ